MRTGADVLIENLHQNGVRHVFGMPGSHSTHIYDAIHRHGGIETILCRNEQAGAFMSDGYARVTGRPGVVCTTAGPGATNALTGLAEAFADSIPVLLIAGQVNHDRMHEECGRYHEIDLEGIFRPCTRLARTVMHNDQIRGIVRDAFQAMTAGRPGSAAIILPQDLMAHSVETQSIIEIGTGLKRLRPDESAIRRVHELIASHQRPILLAGGGAVWSDAGAEIKELALRLDCPVITTLNGKGIIDERDAISLGHGRSVRAGVALPHADLLLAIACRFTEVFTWFGKLPIPNDLIQIDIDSNQIGMNYPVALGIVADAKATLQAILRECPPRRSQWNEIVTAAQDTKHPKPEWFIETLRAELPENAIVFTDASEMAIRMQTDYPAYAPRTFFYPSNYITLGWGFPAAVGAAVASRDRQVVSVSGDGGFLMTAQELATAVRYQLKLIAIVHNDSAYGAIKNLQRVKHAGRFHDTNLNNPDFLVLAEAYGIPSVRAENSATFAKALREALGRGGPSLIEVPDMWRSLRV
ncbi:MAG: thiamine pyrophosphate-binding protein [Planctomycetes bacterium]|nr:thiamine pyrophosphate-binding protein [Planctomycetota bacterium]